MNRTEKNNSGNNRMFPFIIISVSLFILFASEILVTGCATKNGTSMRGQEVSVRYAEIIAVEREQLPSAAPAGAVVGGFTGLILARNRSAGSQIASGVGGAVLGALATKALEGDRLGYAYRLRFSGGNESRFITEKGYFDVGDCVAVERGNNINNLRRAPSSMCEPRPGSKPNLVHVNQAQQCVRAKEKLLAAETSEQIESATRKVEVICQF